MVLPAYNADMSCLAMVPKGGFARLRLGDHAITPPSIGSGVPQGAHFVREWGWPVRQGFPTTP